MLKTTLFVAPMLLLGLVLSSVEAAPAFGGPCLRACTEELEWCYEYRNENNTNDACLSYYYACNLVCNIGAPPGRPRPRSVDADAEAESPANETVAGTPPAL